MTHREWLGQQLPSMIIHQLLLEGDDPCDDWPAEEFIPEDIYYDREGPR